MPDIYQLKLPYSRENIYATSKTPLIAGSKVIVSTRYGMDAADVMGIAKKPLGVRQNEIVEVERLASDDEVSRIKEFEAKEPGAYKVFKEKAAARNLNLKAISVHFMIDGQKAIFFFSADARVDFRDLVRDLVGIFRMRIELRQVSSRDEARMMGGLSLCGRPLCCLVTDKMRPVSIKMAKEQSLSLNSAKVSGQCGRLLCCLAFESDWYSEARKSLPPEGVRVTYDGTTFCVTEANPISSMVRMLGEDGRMIEVNAKRFHRDESNRYYIE